MSRDNVSEMARVMCGRDKDCLVCPVQSPCLMRNCAELLNAEGYRKSEDVADGIFAEIETSLSIANFKGGEIYYAIRAEDYLHYKKKYTGLQE